MKEVKDRFSKQASTYAKYRPHYPEELYQIIFAEVSHFGKAWDVATGNGQVASVLARHFAHVLANDISASQLASAPVVGNIEYHLGRAENLDLGDTAFDLITIAQAIHWFDIPAFMQKVEHSLRPGGVLAIWGYDLLVVRDENINALVRHLYGDILTDYWDPERGLVESHYSGVDLPFEQTFEKTLVTHSTITIDQLEGYLTSWSAVQRYIERESHSPVDSVMEEIKKISSGPIEISQEIFLKMGKKPNA